MMLMVTGGINRALEKFWLTAQKRVMCNFGYKDVVQDMVQSKLLMTKDTASQLHQLLQFVCSEMSFLSRAIGLDRDIFDCFYCPVVEKESIYCLLHPQQKLVSKTYLRNFKLFRREEATNFFAIYQHLHTQVYCPISARCKEVRHLSYFFLFFFV